jgi:putative ABC transport system substrate-binding protein
MKRRDFLVYLSAATSAGALTARAQQQHSPRHIAVFSYQAASDPEAKLYMATFLQGLREFGWVVERNLRIDYRWTETKAELISRYAAEVVALSPEVVLAAGGTHVGALQRESRSVPIIFVQVADAVGGGYVASLARPGGNATGFTNFDYNFSAKWLELLKTVAPQMTRVAVLEDPRNPSGAGQVNAVRAAAGPLAVEVVPVSLRDADELERGITAFAAKPSGGIIVTPSGLAIVRRDLVIALAKRHALPAIYPFRYFAVGGGLLSYGPDILDQYRLAAGYVDRVLRGAKPADLPVQESSKVDLVANLETARSLGITIPRSILARASEVIQ